MNYVALQTYVDEYAGMFYEEGGIYAHEPTAPARPLAVGEATVECPRCGQRFADTDDGTAKANRDLHFDGDEDCPAVCRHLPDRRIGLLRRV